MTLAWVGVTPLFPTLLGQPRRGAEISEMYPLVEVLDLLRDVHDWTGFADHFTYVRTGDAPRNVSAMLADATNFGPKRMAGASSRNRPHAGGCSGVS